jgi:hypothetical protein
MLFARILSTTLALVALLLIVAHIMSSPAVSLRQWIASSKVTKSAAFNVNGLPTDVSDFSWTSMWGRNRPANASAEPILSEFELLLFHNSRGGHVILEVTGDNEVEVDTFLQTIRNDFERTYDSTSVSINTDARSSYDSTLDYGKASYYWRQKYLWLLCGVLFASTLLTISLKNVNQRIKQQAEQTASCNH